MEAQNILDLIQFADGKMQKIPVFESSRYFFDIYCLKPGQEQRVHTHPESDKIYVVLRGRAVFHIAGEDSELTDGHAVIARPGEAHGVRNASADDAVLLVFMTPRP